MYVRFIIGLVTWISAYQQLEDSTLTSWDVSIYLIPAMLARLEMMTSNA